MVRLFKELEVIKKMKKIIIGIIFIIFAISFAFIFYYVFTTQSVIADDGKLLLAQAKDATTKKPNPWVAKIDDFTLTLEDFKREFSVHVYSLPLDEQQKEKYKNDDVNKKKFLTNLISEYLIYMKSLDEGYNKRDDVKDLIKAVTRRAIIQVYLNEKIEPKLKDIPDQEIENIYNQNKKLFAGVDIDVARQQIKMQLLQKQYNDYLDDIINDLLGVAKVLRNDDVNL